MQQPFSQAGSALGISGTLRRLVSLCARGCGSGMHPVLAHREPVDGGGQGRQLVARQAQLAQRGEAAQAVRQLPQHVAVQPQSLLPPAETINSVG